MAQSDAQAKWLSLIEYSIKNNISLSTLRRHIKTDKVIYRMHSGKYFILDESEPKEPLESQLQKARKEITELKMLVEIYEEKFNTKDHTPFS